MTEIKVEEEELTRIDKYLQDKTDYTRSKIQKLKGLSSGSPSTSVIRDSSLPFTLRIFAHFSYVYKIILYLLCNIKNYFIL